MGVQGPHMETTGATTAFRTLGRGRYGPFPSRSRIPMSL